MGNRKTIFILMAALLLALPLNSVFAQERVRIVVKTILASQSSKGVEKALTPMVKELNSVFRYSSYQTLKTSRMTIRLNSTGKTSLPGKRTLSVTPMRIQNNRVELKILILKGKRSTFRTTVQLRNGSSITVGGPKYKGGYLLFNISGSF